MTSALVDIARVWWSSTTDQPGLGGSFSWDGWFGVVKRSPWQPDKWQVDCVNAIDQSRSNTRWTRKSWQLQHYSIANHAFSMNADRLEQKVGIDTSASIPVTFSCEIKTFFTACDQLWDDIHDSVTSLSMSMRLFWIDCGVGCAVDEWIWHRRIIRFFEDRCCMESSHHDF